MPSAFLAIAGNIGVGKTSFTGLLARDTGALAAFEAVEENPYLADFYRDMARWGFPSQVFFLSRRIRQHHELLAAKGKFIIQDRSLYEDAEVFARNLHLSGKLTGRDWKTYDELYQAVSQILKPPNLIVYLKASVPVLMARIKQRGREYEKSMSEEYVTRLNVLYDEWATTFKRAPVLTIDTDQLDFVAHPDHLQRLVAAVKAKL